MSLYSIAKSSPQLVKKALQQQQKNEDMILCITYQWYDMISYYING